MKIALFVLYAVGVALSAGLYFVFSTTIMSALKQLEANSARDTMTMINKVIQNPLFLSVFFGTAGISAVIVFVMYQSSTPLNSWIIGSFIAYFLGVFLVTIFFNVPMNNRLEQSVGLEYWNTYLNVWTKWNHVRTYSSVLSIILLVIGIFKQKL